MCHTHLDNLHLLLCRFDWFRGQSCPVAGRLHQCKRTSDWLEIRKRVNNAACAVLNEHGRMGVIHCACAATEHVEG